MGVEGVALDGPAAALEGPAVELACGPDFDLIRVGVDLDVVARVARRWAVSASILVICLRFPLAGEGLGGAGGGCVGTDGETGSSAGLPAFFILRASNRSSEPSFDEHTEYPRLEETSTRTQWFVLEYECDNLFTFFLVYIPCYHHTFHCRHWISVTEGRTRSQ